MDFSRCKIIVAFIVIYVTACGCLHVVAGVSTVQVHSGHGPPDEVYLPFSAFDSPYTGQRNICSVCSCTGSEFITVNCVLTDGAEERFFTEITLDDRYTVPVLARSFNIDLRGSRHSIRLVIDPSLFNGTSINRFSIQGGDGSHEHVEFKEKALCLNKGTFPEVEIASCHTLVFKASFVCAEFKLNVTNAREVVLMSGFLSLAEGEISLDSIHDLRIMENAFQNSVKTRVHISNSVIDQLGEMRASFRELRFVNTNITQVQPKAFDVLKIDLLVFDGCTVQTFHTQAITEKMLCKQLLMRNCKIDRIEQRFIDGNGLTNLTLEDNFIKELSAEAIRFTGVSSTIVRNKILRTGPNWLTLTPGWSRLTIADNAFGVFDVFAVEKSAATGVDVCTFRNNSIKNAAPGSFSFFNQVPAECHIAEIQFDQECNCEGIPQQSDWLHRLQYRDYVELLGEAFCRVEESLKYCFNGSVFNVGKFREAACSGNTGTDCSKHKRERKFDPHFVSQSEIDSIEGDEVWWRRREFVWVIVASALGIVLAIVFVTVFVCRQNTAQRQRWHGIRQSGNDEFSNSVTTVTPSSAGGNFFGNDDRIIIKETIDKLAKSQQPEDQELYRTISGHVEYLLLAGDDLESESETVQRIGEIVDCLNELQIPGDDFVAFTDVLYRGLKPRGNITVLTDVGNDEHIYAELQPRFATAANQPLLIAMANDYAAPMDTAIGGGTGGVDSVLYAEPMVVRLPDILDTNNISGNRRNSHEATAGGAASTANTTRGPMEPMYSLPIKRRRGSSATDSSSDHHSGGSDLTVKIEDVVAYKVTALSDLGGGAAT